MEPLRAARRVIGVGERRMRHIKKYCRCRTAADRFVLRSEQITTSLEGVMRYLCLVYGTEDSLPVMQNPNPTSRAEVDALAQDSLAYNDMLRKSGHFIRKHPAWTTVVIS